MNNLQTGELIRHLRLEKKMTQDTLAQKLNVTYQAVSKWERGWGLPDITLLPELSDILGVDLKDMLRGSLEENEGSKMKNIHYFVCPSCGNLVFCTEKASISCCGRTIKEIKPIEAKDNQKMLVQEVEYDWYITSDHPMTKDNYISFSAFQMNGKIEVIKHFPEWKLELRVPRRGKGKLLWYSQKEGLRYQLL